MHTRWVSILAVAMALGFTGQTQAATVRLAWHYTQGATFAVKHRVYRQVGCTGAWVRRGEVRPIGAGDTVLQFTDTGAQRGKRYCWRVTAVAADGKQSRASNVVAFKVPTTTGKPPQR